ncbi:hypothetical protein, partial [Methylomonas rivi]
PCSHGAASASVPEQAHANDRPGRSKADFHVRANEKSCSGSTDPPAPDGVARQARDCGSVAVAVATNCNGVM